MGTRERLEKLAVTLGLAVATKFGNAQTVEPKVSDRAEHKIEMTTTQNLEQSCVVIGSTDFEKVLSEKDVKEAEKLIKKFAKKYKWSEDELNSFISEKNPEQGHLYIETLVKNEKEFKVIRWVPVRHPYYNGPKERPIMAAKGFSFYDAHTEDGQEMRDRVHFDKLSTIVNARDVMEKSGLDLKDPTKKKFLIRYYYDDYDYAGDNKYKLETPFEIDLLSRVGYTIDMRVDPKTGKLNGVSTITQYRGKNKGGVASLTYENGKFISGEVNGKPIKEVDNTKQLAMKKVLSRRSK